MLTSFVPKIIAKFSTIHPNIRIILHEYSYADLCHALQKGIVDIAFMNDAVPKGYDFIMPTAGWDDLVIMVTEKFPFTPKIRHYTASDTVAFAMVSENLGVYIMSKLQTAFLPDNIIAKDFKEPAIRNMGFCAKSFKNITPALRELIRLTYSVI